jgi:hypothetical protein
MKKQLLLGNDAGFAEVGYVSGRVDFWILLFFSRQGFASMPYLLAEVQGKYTLEL